MFVCLYGRTCAPFVGPIARDFKESALACGAELVPLTVEEAVARPTRWRGVEGVYVLPFDVPGNLPRTLPACSGGLVRALFPAARILNEIAVHEFCRDRLAVAERLLNRGVPMPDSLITENPEEVRRFVAEHEHAVLKAPRTCGGLGHLVVSLAPGEILVGECMSRRYVLDLVSSHDRHRLDHGILSVPGPFYVQRLVAERGRQGRLFPAQVLRAYVVDGQAACWTERYREHYRRPSDFIVTVTLGARYRFLHSASDEAQKLALRTADVLGVRFGVVDLIRTGSEGPYPLAAHTDGPQMYIDREFKQVPEFRPSHDFDRFLVEALVQPTRVPAARGLRSGVDARRSRRGH